MRLTMKAYTDVAQLPSAATVRGLPSIGDSQIDSQTLAAGRLAVSPSGIGLKAIKVGKTIGTIDGNHGATAVKIVVATSSLMVPNSMQRGHMLSDKWLDAAKFPEITFEAKGFKNVKNRQ